MPWNRSTIPAGSGQLESDRIRLQVWGMYSFQTIKWTNPLLIDSLRKVSLYVSPYRNKSTPIIFWYCNYLPMCGGVPKTVVCAMIFLVISLDFGIQKIPCFFGLSYITVYWHFTAVAIMQVCQSRKWKSIVCAQRLHASCISSCWFTSCIDNTPNQFNLTFDDTSQNHRNIVVFPEPYHKLKSVQL